MSIGISATIPALHCIYLEGFWTVFYEMSLNWIILVGIVYCSGAFIYVCRFPERFFPGQCDIWVRLKKSLYVRDKMFTDIILVPVSSDFSCGRCTSCVHSLSRHTTIS